MAVNSMDAGAVRLMNVQKAGREFAFAGLIVILAITILYPMFWALLGSFQTDEGVWTLAHYKRVFTPYYLRVMGTTLIYAFSSVLLSLAVAMPLAWLVARSDMPGKGLVRAATVITFVMPPLFHALAFVFLLQPRTGLVNELFEYLTGFRPFNIYSMSGLVFATVCGLFPQAFLLLDSAFRNIDPSLEEAAAITGANQWQTAGRVVFPLVLPAILSSVVLGMIEVLAVFGPPAVIGIPAKIYVMSTQIFVELASSPPRMEFAAALSILFLAIAGALLLLQDRLLRRRGFTTVAGKGSRPKLVALGRWRWVAFGGSAFVLIVTLVLPTLMLVVVSFSRVWTQGPSLQNLTFDFYRAALGGGYGALASLGNTLIFAITTLVATIALGLPIAWIITRGNGLRVRVLRWLVYLPFSIPAVVFTVGVVLAYIRPPLVLYGSMLIIVVCYFGRFLPFAVQPLSDGLRQIDRSLTEAARVVGSGVWQTATRIVMPMLKYATLSTAMLIFVACVREIVSIALLYSPGNESLMMTAMLLWDEGQAQITAALVVVIIVLAGSFYAIAQYLSRKKTKAA